MTTGNDQIQDLRAAFARVTAAGNAAYQAASKAMRASGAADEADEADEASWAADEASRAADEASRAADEASRAADAVDAARWAADAASRAADAAGAAEAAFVAGRAADAADAADAARLAAEAAGAARLAVAATEHALLETARVFSGLTLASDVSTRSRAVLSTVRPLGRVTVRLVTLSAAILPAGHRGRYAEEWSSLLFELGTRRSRARQVVSIVAGTPRQAWALRHPLKETPPA